MMERREARAREPGAGLEKHAPARGQLIDEAARIAEQIRARVHRLDDGGVTWLGPTGYGTELSPLRVLRLGPNLYRGTLGIALFLGAVARVIADGELRRLSLEAVAPLRRRLGELLADPAAAGRIDVPLGGLIGLGSYIYGLLTLSRLVEEPALLVEAHEATTLITAERIGNDRQVRVQTGSAGAILALLALHARMPGANRRGTRPLAVARECGRHLLLARVSFEGRPQAWALSPGKPPVAGFCYGAAGICYALLRLYGETGERELWEAAQEGLAFARGLYSPQQRKWRDLRALFEARYRPRQGTWRDWWLSGSLDDLEPRVAGEEVVADRFPDLWCHGSSGIALGKIASLPLDDSAPIRAEIAGVLADLRDAAREGELADGDVDDLCCGQMGRAEVLLCASLRLGDESCRDAALRLAARVRRRARAQGRYFVSAARGSDHFAPSLFQGVAGVGYTFLRLALPHELPSLLLFE
jgi:lantibiotic modifying enzyme